MTDLKPCPWCMSLDVQKYDYRVVCNNCHCEGPDSTFKDLSNETPESLWNQREVEDPETKRGLEWARQQGEAAAFKRIEAVLKRKGTLCFEPDDGYEITIPLDEYEIIGIRKKRYIGDKYYLAGSLREALEKAEEEK